MRDELLKGIADSVAAVQVLAKPEAVLFMERLAAVLSTGFRTDKKVLIAGNGGSLCDAMHFAEELTGYFREKRPALSAIALADPGHMSCVANDSSFDEVFARGVEAHGRPGDIFIGLTTSGNSPNISRAVEKAKGLGMTTVAFLGKTGGQLKGQADLELLIEGFSTSDRIQEAHMAAMHLVIEQVENQLFQHA